MELKIFSRQLILVNLIYIQRKYINLKLVVAAKENIIVSVFRYHVRLFITLIQLYKKIIYLHKFISVNSMGVV